MVTDKLKLTGNPQLTTQDSHCVFVVYVYAVIEMTYLISIFMCTQVFLGKFMCTMCLQAPSEAKGLQIPGTGAAGNCEPSNVGAGR